MSEDTNVTQEETTRDPQAETQEPNPKEKAETKEEPQEDSKVADLMKKLAAQEKALKTAEDALKNEKSQHAALKRTTKTEAELLEEKQKEVEENAKKYQRMMANAKAKSVLSGTGLSEDEYSPILELITSEDEDLSESIANEIKTILANQAKVLEKTLREKIMKETPQPPAGGSDNTNKEYEAKIRKAMGLM